MRSKRAAATARPSEVAVGRIRHEVSVVIETPGELVFTTKGIAAHVFLRNVRAKQFELGRISNAYGVAFFALEEEGTYLFLAPTPQAFKAALRDLDNVRVQEPFVCSCGAQRCRCEGRRSERKLVPLLIRAESVLTSAHVQLFATGSGGKQGVRYHALYAHTPPTGYEPELNTGSETAVEYGGSRHTGVTGRVHVPGPKRGYGN